MNKYIIICREGAVLDVALNAAYGNPCLGFAYAEDEIDALKKIVALHRQLTTEEEIEPERMVQSGSLQAC